MKTERRWLKSILNEAKKPVQPMPWSRQARQVRGQATEKRRASR